jgi:hypothetical protein
MAEIRLSGALVNRRKFVTYVCAAGVAGPAYLKGAAAMASRPIVIEAGRRVDAPDAQSQRFPAANVPRVRARIEQYLKRERPTGVVSSAACGTDLLLLDLAGQMSIPQTVVLGTDPETFRKSSVIDRPGDWGDLYDHVLKTAKVETLKVAEGQEGYLQTNIVLLDRGQSLAAARGVPAQALVVWNKQSRGEDDVTEHFLKQAEKKGIPVVQISTL